MSLKSVIAKEKARKARAKVLNQINDAAEAERRRLGMSQRTYDAYAATQKRQTPYINLNASKNKKGRK